MKKCTRCRAEKELAFFNKNKNTRDGYENRCRDCAIRAGRKYVFKIKKLGVSKIGLKNPNGAGKKESSRAWQLRNPERVKAKARRAWLKNRYGISEHIYSKMLREQNFCCAICEKQKGNFIKGLAVDHCHKTGKIRSLLCTVCNTGLGSFEDNPMLLAKAMRYLLRYEKMFF